MSLFKTGAWRIACLSGQYGGSVGLLVRVCHSFAGFLLPSLPPLIGLSMLYALLGASRFAGK